MSRGATVFSSLWVGQTENLNLWSLLLLLSSRTSFDSRSMAVCRVDQRDFSQRVTLKVKSRR